MTGTRQPGDGDLLLESRFRQALAGLVPTGARLLLAVSGGSDSMGLMHLAAGVRAEAGLALTVGFVDHGLRSGTDEEWAVVRSAAGKLDLDARRVAVDAAESLAAPRGDSLQQWAREARYRLLAGLAGESGCDHLALGHTRDDQAETVLLRALRGAGIDGMGGMPARRESGGIALVRPLLGHARSEIRDWLRRRSVAWVEDPSNADPRFERVRVRGELLPLMERWHPGVSERLAALSTECREVAEFVDRVCQEGGYLRQLRLGGGFAVGVDRVPAGVRSRMVRALLRRVRGDLRGIERVHVDALLDVALRGASTDAIPLPGTAVAYAHGHALFAFPRPLPARPSGSGQPAAMGPGRWRLRFAALGALAEIGVTGSAEVGDLELRARRPGDRVFRSDRKLKEVLNDAKVPRPYRDFVPVLAGPDGVLACPGFLPCRHPGLEVRWLLDDGAPILDVDFPLNPD
ncbi:MAG TPA: tRNA lysidine(34) synthetase TilS [Polyangia bacterium]|nr:tRNA lysidine(34) synthetase TilS [Polyangia bacterium]